MVKLLILVLRRVDLEVDVGRSVGQSGFHTRDVTPRWPWMDMTRSFESYSNS